MSALVSRLYVSPEESRAQEAHRERRRQEVKRHAWTGWVCPGCGHEHVTRYAIQDADGDLSRWVKRDCIHLHCENLDCNVSVRVSFDTRISAVAARWAAWSKGRREHVVKHLEFVSKINGYLLQNVGDGDLIARVPAKYPVPHPPLARFDPRLDVPVQAVEPIGDSTVRVTPTRVTILLPSGVVHCDVVASDYTAQRVSSGWLEAKIEQPDIEQLREELLVGFIRNSDTRAAIRDAGASFIVKVRQGLTVYTWRACQEGRRAVAEAIDPSPPPTPVEIEEVNVAPPAVALKLQELLDQIEGDSPLGITPDVNAEALRAGLRRVTGEDPAAEEEGLGEAFDDWEEDDDTDEYPTRYAEGGL